jgi:hypothetical protein
VGKSEITVISISKVEYERTEFWGNALSGNEDTRRLGDDLPQDPRNVPISGKKGPKKQIFGDEIARIVDLPESTGPAAPLPTTRIAELNS